MISFENLLGSVRSYNPETDADLLHRAYEFSALEHAGQVRRSGEQYITHPLEVAHLVAEMHLDDVTIASSLLHDVVEDTLTTIENVRGLFGPEIAHVVEGVTKISTIPFSSSEERQAENFRKMLLAMVDDVRVILVKLADRLHNMRTLDHLREDRRLKISQETIDIYAPIAHRLGMNKVKNELEDLAFRHLDPPGYESLRAGVEARRRATERTVDSLKSTLADKLRDAGVPIVALEGRIKSIFSIWKKIRRQKISLDEVYDLLAVRVITASERDCYAALGIIHQIWAPVHGRFKDFVAMPRPNGYQSLHTAVISDLGLPFEVQIRSEDMHRIAEHGIAAHWKYKEGRVGADPDEKYFLWLRQLLEWQQEVPDPSEFIHSLKLDLYPEEVYTFTPKGEVKALPRGATPIDFAYAIHTDVGHTCVGARVNGRMVPLRTPLQSGDIVEVVTRAGNRPNRDWAEYRRDDACAQQDQALHPPRGEAACRGARPQAAREGGAPLRSQAQDGVGSGRGRQGLRHVQCVEAGRPLCVRRLRQGLVPRRAGRPGSSRAARAREIRSVHCVRGSPRASSEPGDHQGTGIRRPDGVPGRLLQSDPRGENRRLRHPRQGRLGPRRELSERREPLLRSSAADRCSLGQGEERSRRSRSASPFRSRIAAA